MEIRLSAYIMEVMDPEDLFVAVSVTVVVVAAAAVVLVVDHP